MIRIVIADDHTVVRQGLQRVIEQQPDMRLVGEAADGRQALQIAAEREFEILILDLSLPRVNGMEVLRRVRAEQPALRLIILSMYPADQYKEQLLAQGAAAYVQKDAPAEELLHAIRTVAAGGSVVGATRPSSIEAARPPHKLLTAREYQVFTLLFQEQTVSEIAAELDLSPSTVSNHIAKIREKLGVNNIAGIVRYAHEAGMAGPTPPKR